jgi:ribosomal protein S18 acetylase RimI-like enzyme
VAGFLMLLQSAGTLVIDLIAVERAARGNGLAAAMIRFAGHHFAQCGVLRVGTQVANIPATRLYEKLGFRMRCAHYVLHRHISANQTPEGSR